MEQTELSPLESKGPPSDDGNGVDSILQELKGMFYQGKKVPDLVADYDVLGFDADHCLVKYHVKNLMLLVARIQGVDLHLKGGYPKEMTHFDELTIDICLNNAVWDIQRGNILKLVEGKVVARAYHGFQELSSLQIEAAYGTPPIFSSLNYPQVIRDFSPVGGYFVLMTYFDCCKIPVVCKAIELIDSGIIKVSYGQFAEDLMKSILRQYAHYNLEECFSIREFGDFFPEVIKNPSKYIEAQPELRKSLEKLIGAGKLLFLATNSHFEYMEFIMEQSLGADWKTLFCLSCANS